MLNLARFCGMSSLRAGVLLNPKFARHPVKLTRNCSDFLFQRQQFKLGNYLKNNHQIRLNSNKNAPQKDRKIVGYWLATCGGMVFVAVVLGIAYYYLTFFSVSRVVEENLIFPGGVTRLTESGLSMVTWKLLGEKMPRTQLEWEEEFKKYQQFPEFKVKNKEMTLAEFKRIWHMEYGHRMWGRAIGGAFFIPAAFFWAKGYFPKWLKIRVAVFGSLIAAQGLMGWYMVKSGLEDRFDGPNDIPRVSQYRLASHLGLAFVLYTTLLWSSLHILLPAEKFKYIDAGTLRRAQQIRWGTHLCKTLVFITAISGAFVAGLDAGLVYNSFPMMADKWIPDDILAYTPKLSNFTENPTTVQFDHRVLGVSSLTAISVLFLLSRRRVLPSRAHTAINAMTAAAWLQVVLGISTLLTYVPTSLAACHQSGSLIVLSTAIWLAHELKKLPKSV